MEDTPMEVTLLEVEVTLMVMVLVLGWVVVVFLEVVEGAVHLVEVEAAGIGKKVLAAFPLYPRFCS
jgi:hypothetical protein